jgi:AraC family transcriptional regulator of adaptative response / DNA-3-methyladenine glycosylase II
MVDEDGTSSERCYRAVASKDPRFDGVFYTAVTSTGIYCRPSCPAMTPKRSNLRFYRTAAAAQGAGFRACKRCRPDSTPGSPEWDVRADVAGRVMRLIADGFVDREGVPGLAARIGFSERHLNRQLVAELGAGPLALARARRAQTARLLIETTGLTFADIAFASGFASVRQFNDTVREVYAATPRGLRAAAGGAGPTGRTAVGAPGAGAVGVRLALRQPFDAQAMLDFLRAHAVPGVEEVLGSHYRRTLRLPRGWGVVDLDVQRTGVTASVHVADLRDVPSAIERCRRALDLDADPQAVSEAFCDDPVLGPLVRRRPGLRVPGAVDGAETAVRAVVGQQISVAGARTVLGRLVQRAGEPLPRPDGGLTHLFPEPAALAEHPVEDLPMPRARGRTLTSLAAGLAAGDVVLDRGADREQATASLTALPGVGPWTASYIALRALGDPDAYLPSDVGLRRALARLGRPSGAATHPTAATAAQATAAAAAQAQAWRPWRAYALLHLWTSLTDPIEEPA